MPTYRFENTETGEIFEKWMYMAEKEAISEREPTSQTTSSDTNERWRGWRLG